MRNTWRTTKLAEKSRSIARTELGETSEKATASNKRGAWWWNQEVQEKLKNKRKAEKAWDTTRDDASKLAYKTARKEAKREVAKTRNKKYEKLYERLETRDGQKELFKIVKQRDGQSKDVQQVKVIKSNNEEMFVEEKKVKQRWKEYFEKLLNQENPRERRKRKTEKREGR